MRGDRAGGTLWRRVHDGWLAVALLAAAGGHRVSSVTSVASVVGVYASVFAGIRRFPNDAHAIGHRVHRVGAHLPFVACLEEAVVCHAILEAHGIDSELHLGVDKPSGEILVAHAWVTANDRVVVGGDDRLSDYTPLPLTQWP